MPVGIEGGVGRMRSGGFGLERGEATGMEIVEGIAHGLVVAPSSAGKLWGRLSCGARQEHVAPAHGKTARRPQPDFQRYPFVGRKRSNKKWCLHTE